MFNVNEIVRAPRHRPTIRYIQLLLLLLAIFFGYTVPAYAQGTVSVAITAVNVPDPLQVGEEVEYRISWSCSSSTSSCNNYELGYTLPPELEFVTIVTPPGLTTTYTPGAPGGGQALFEFSGAGGTVLEVTITARVGYYESPNPNLDVSGTITATVDATGSPTPVIPNVTDAPSPVDLDSPTFQWSVNKVKTQPAGSTQPAVDSNVGYQLSYCSDSPIGNVDVVSAVMTDTFPAGAVIINPDGGVVDTINNTIVWSLGDLEYYDYVAPGNCVVKDILVQYPSPTFNTGDPISNGVEGAAGGVGPIGSDTADNTLADPEINLSFSKSNESQIIGPDAVAEFNLAVDNTQSNVSAEDLIVVENLPAELELTHIKTGAWNQAPGVTADVQIATRAAPSAWITLGTVGSAANTTYSQVNGDFGTNIGAVRWVFNMPSGPGIPGGFESSTPLRIWAKPSAPIAPGVNQISNCADAIYIDPDNPPATLTQQDCGTVDISADPVTVMDFDKRSTPNNNVAPGDTINYRLDIKHMHESSAPLINPYVEDLLPAEFTFISWDDPSTDFGGNTPVFTMTNDYLGTGQTRLEWKWNSWTITNTPNDRVQETYTINYSVTPKVDTPPGNLTNSATLDSESPNVDCNTSDSATCSKNKNMNVVDVGLLMSEKWVDGHDVFNHVNIETNSSENFVFDAPEDPSCPDDGSGLTRYPCIARTYAGEPFPYKIVITNGGNITLTNYILYDVLPHIGDVGVSEVLAGDSRGSRWQPLMTGPITIDALPSGMSNADIVIEYSDSFNSCRDEVSASSNESGWQPGCVNDWTTTPDVWDDVKSFRIYFLNSNVKFPPQSSMTFGAIMFVPETGVPSGTIAWNSVAHRATNDFSGSRLLSSDPPKVGIATLYSDWGDLPDIDGDPSASPAYDTDINTNGGPRHLVRRSLYLGAGVDAEEDGQPNDGTNGDDSNTGDITVGIVPPSGDDEDGINFLTDVIMPGDPVQIEVSAFISGSPGITATLGAWIDFNGDGDFNDPNEFTVLTLINPAGTGANITDTISLTAPVDVSETIYSRFRLAFNPDEVGQLNDATGEARSGEVEDYVLMSLGNRVWLDNGIGGGIPDNGLLDGSEYGIEGVAVELYRGGDTPGVSPPLAVITTTNDGYYTFTGLLEEDYIVYIPSSNFATTGALVDHLSSGDATSGGTDPDDDTNNDDNGIDDLNPAANGIRSLPVSLTYGNEPTNDGNNRASNISVDFGFVQHDWGDLPDGNATNTPNYNSTDANGGPSHVLVSGLSIGSVVDPESNGQPSPTSTGDDTLTGTDTQDDEDGITSFPLIVAGQIVTISVSTVNTLTEDAILYGFIDFDGDGNFNGPNEVVTATVTPSSIAGTTGLAFDVPVNSPINNHVGARFRLSTDPTLGPDNGAANGDSVNGEVEDYIIEVIGHEYGDLPDGYGTLENGAVTTPAYHVITDTLYFGSVIDNEGDGQPDVNAGQGATGGDNNVTNPKGDDEDGIQFMTPIMSGTTAIISITAYVSDSIGTAYYGAWIDIEGDGTFSADEYFSGSIVNPGGAPNQVVALNIPIPAGATVSDTIYSRFRLSADQSEVDELVDSVGAAATGEVEDYVLMSIGNQVWLDNGAGVDTNDGILDVGESGVDGVAVELYTDDDGTPGFSIGDTLVATATTQGGGYYIFTGLIADDYVVHIPGANFEVDSPLQGTLSSDGDSSGNDGADNGNDPAPASNPITIRINAHQNNGVSSDVITLDYGTEPGVGIDGNGENSDLTVDFGFVPYRDYGDLPDIYSTFDANNGSYHILDGMTWLGGSVDDEVDGQPDTGAGMDGTGGDDSNGTADDEDGITFLTPIMPGQPVQIEVSAYITGGAGITATVGAWLDLDGDGVFTSTEFISITLTGGTGTVTDTITFTAPSTVADENYARFRIARDPTEVGQVDDFDDGASSGEVEDYVLMSLGNQVWFDTDNDGLLYNGESGVSGVTVELYDNTNNLVATTTTNASGRYTFTGLIADTYTVVLPGSNFATDGPLHQYISSDPTDANPDDDTTESDDNGINPGTYGDYLINGVSSGPVTLIQEGEPTTDGNGTNSNLAVDFGFYQLSVGHTVWEDLNNDGVINSSESGIPGIEMAILDASGTVVMTTTTDASGQYTFTGLISGTYIISMTMPAGYLPSTGADQEADPDSNGNDNDNGQDTVTNGAIISAPFDLTANDAGAAKNNMVDNSDGSTHNPTVDFGIYRPVNLGNQVWYDLNNDGQLDPTEHGIVNVNVELYLDTNGNGIFDVGDTFVDSTTTNSTGHYTFTDLVPTTNISTTYLVVITNTNFTTGGQLLGSQSSLRDMDAPDPDDNTDNDDNGTPIAGLGVVASAPIELGVGEETSSTNNPDDSNWTVDFGFVQFDYGDLPTSYNTVLTTTAGITPAHHTIVYGLFLGSGVDSEFDGQPSTGADGDGDGNGTATGDGTDDEDGISFNANPLGDPVLLAGQPFTITVDVSTAGYLNAWFDWNNDGNLDGPDEHIIADTQVVTGPNTITFMVGNGASADDIYSRFRFSSDDPAGAMGSEGFWPNGEVEDYIVPAIERFSLGNRIWHDLNNDGLLNAGESGIPNVVVNLLDAAGIPVTDTIAGLPITTTTDADGYYIFDGLETGGYIVEVDASNFGTGQPLEDWFSSTGAGQETDPNSDGESNDNGVDDPANYLTNGIRSAPVKLSSDPSSSGVGEPEQADGETDVDLNSNGPDGHGNVTSDAYSQLTVDFGFFEPVTVGDRVWFDHNHNGVQDAGETGVPNVDTTLFVISGTMSIMVTVDAFGNPLPQQTTNSSGNYLYENLPPGNYYVEFDLTDIPTAYQTTLQATTTDAADSDVDITGRTDLTGFIESGGENLGLDMGIWIPSSLGNTVWYDNDHDGTYEPADGELGVPNIGVTLWVSGTNSPIMTTTTDINGTYLFSNLIPGDYFVEFDLSTVPAGYTVTLEDVASDPTDTDDSDADPNTGRSHVTSLGPGDHDPTLDMGIYSKVSVGDRVWIDDDYDGEQDAGEAGVPNIGITLYNSLDPSTPLSTTTTDANGNYLFANLDPGSYFVQFDVIDPDIPAGYQVTKQSESGVSDTNDSDADPATGNTAATDFLFANESDMTLDMGIWTVVSVGDRVWYDNNGDGVQDVPSDEPGVPNVDVTLYTLDASSNPVNTGQTTTTDSNGYYTFTNLIPGQYLVEFDASTLPATYSPTTPDQGGDDASDSDVDPATMRTPATLFLIGGEDDPTLDLGIVAPVRVGDTVWYDNDRDGIQDGDETGVANVTVLLYDGAGNPVLDGGGNQMTTTTDPNGYYEFANLPPGEYMAQFDLSTLPADYVPTSPNQGGDDALDSDASASTGFTAATPFLTAGQQDMTLDMGIIQLGDQVRVGDYVWEDLNADGIQDAGEPGIENVTVRLYYDNGTPTGHSAQTDTDGLYLFDDLPPGNYYVEFDLNTLPSGYFVSPQDAGSDDTADSDADPNFDGQTPSTGYLSEGSQDLSLDMGIYKLASLGDYVWEDTDADGVQESGESPIANITVNLLDNSGNLILDGSGNPISTMTDVNGYYQFSNLLPGDYMVEFVPPTGYILSTSDVESGNPATDDELDSDADPVIGSPSFARSPVVTLESGEHNPTIDAGLHRPASIGNYIWEDQNGDGIQDNTESPVENVTVNLYDSAGNLAGTTTTDANGFYGFTGLTPGDYFVEVVPPTGFIITYNDQGSDDALDSDADPAMGRTPVIAVDSDEHDSTWDVGLVQPAQLGDTVWFDANSNGLQDANEDGVPYVTVNLYTAHGTLMESTVTDADGYYDFDDLLPGDYYIEVIEPDGYTFTTLNEGGDDTLDSDVDIVTGVMDTTTLLPGENDLSWDAGLIKLASLGDSVWYDTNQNGVQDGGENGVAGVTVILLDINGNQIDQTVTDGNGNYLFEDLIPGDYAVQFQTPSGYSQSQADQGGNDAFDSDADSSGRTASVTLHAGEHDGSIDIGIFLTNGEPASIENAIWNDADGDGEQGPGELGIPGVVVTLLDESSNVIATTVTGPDGSYQYSNIPPGEYQLQFEFPDGYIASPIDENGNPALSWSENGQTLISPVIILGSDEQDIWQLDVSLDEEPASIGDYVWLDTDLDGIQDAGETGIPGVDVILYRVDSNGNEVEMGSMTTGPDGRYRFDNLPASDYFVKFSTPPGYVPAPNNQGGDDTADSDVDPFTLRTPVTTLGAGEDDPNWDAGFSLGISEDTGASILATAIGNRVWFDADENGVQDVGEANMEGITVNLYAADGSLLASTMTDAKGEYMFNNLAAGDYYVEIVVPDAYTVTLANTGSDDAVDSDVDPDTRRTQSVTLLAGQPNITLDLGLRPQAERTDPGTPTSLNEILEPEGLVPQIYIPIVIGVP